MLLLIVILNSEDTLGIRKSAKIERWSFKDRTIIVFRLRLKAE